MSDHQWITFHRLRFPEVIAAADHSFERVDSADIWRLLPAMRLNEYGAPAFASDIWAAMGVFDTEAEARAIYDDPSAHLPGYDQALETWHAVAIPYAFRGSVKWRDEVETDDVIRVDRSAPKGALAVVTSAGYDDHPADWDGPDDRDRRLKFAAGVMDVVAGYADHPGNLMRDVTNGAAVDGRDGFTLSLWSDDAAMMDAAYKSGVHKAQLDSHKADAMFDRSCFMRLRLQETRGEWPISRAA